MARKLFCEICPVFYKISVKKEMLKRYFKDIFRKEKIAKIKMKEKLPNVVKEHSSILIRKLNGVDLKLQENKVTNIEHTCEKINGIIIRPGETFSFWKTIGKPSKKKGYKEGLVIEKGKLSSGIGGGLCQLANMIHWLVLNSPLEVTELHHHSDALFPDERRKVPFGTGTSVCYNYLDYRFKNQTNQDIQIIVFIQNGELCGELRSNKEFPYAYKLIEENHHYKKENNEYYRISQVYKITMDTKLKKEISKELILNNHSKVMYDYNLIPKEEIEEN